MEVSPLPNKVSEKGKVPLYEDQDEPPPAFRTVWACVSLHMTDRIRLLGFGTGHLKQIEDIIERTWKEGIQSSGQYDAAREIQLYGNPWIANNWHNERIRARRLMCGLFCGLFGMGWILKAPVDVCKKEHDKDTLLFRYQLPPPPPCLWMAISFERGDRLHLIDAPDEFGPALVKMFGHSKVQNHDVIKGGVFEIKFYGYPWRPNGTETVKTRLIILSILECLEQHGFSLYASVNQDATTSSNSHSSDADTWYCNRQVDWTPGAPIYN